MTILMRMNKDCEDDLVLVLIDHRNLEALMSGQPMMVQARDSKLPADVCVAYGHTFDELVADLVATGKFNKEQVADLRRAAERASE